MKRYFTLSLWIGVGLFLSSCGSVQQESAPVVAPQSAGEAILQIYGVPWSAIPAPPAADFAKRPVYPFEAWREKQAGSVKVVFQIDAAGRATEMRCFDYKNPLFPGAVLSALSQWKFPPHAGGPYRLLFNFGPVTPEGAEIDWK